MVLTPFCGSCTHACTHGWLWNLVRAHEQGLWILRWGGSDALLPVVETAVDHSGWAESRRRFAREATNNATESESEVDFTTNCCNGVCNARFESFSVQSIHATGGLCVSCGLALLILLLLSTTICYILVAPSYQ